jgi:hypothetical protein
VPPLVAAMCAGRGPNFGRARPAFDKTETPLAADQARPTLLPIVKAATIVIMRPMGGHGLDPGDPRNERTVVFTGRRE